MAVKPKNLVKNIKDAQKRVQESKKIKVTVKNKANAAPKPTRATRKKTYEDGLSIDEMLKETPPRVKETMERDNVAIQSMRKNSSGTAFLCQTVSRKKNGQTTSYKQVIENLDDETDNFYNSNWIKVQCTCPAFKFWSDWVLHQKGSSDLKFSTDEAPNFTNPQELNMVCKHLLREFIAIKQRKL